MHDRSGACWYAKRRSQPRVLAALWGWGAMRVRGRADRALRQRRRRRGEPGGGGQDLRFSASADDRPGRSDPLGRTEWKADRGGDLADPGRQRLQSAGRRGGIARRASRASRGLIRTELGCICLQRPGSARQRAQGRWRRPIVLPDGPIMFPARCQYRGLSSGWPESEETSDVAGQSHRGDHGLDPGRPDQ